MMIPNKSEQKLHPSIDLLSRRRLLRRVMFSAAWLLVLGALLSLPSLPLLAAEATHSAARLDDAWGKPAPAAEWKQKLAAFQQADKVSDNKSKTP